MTWRTRGFAPDPLFKLPCLSGSLLIDVAVEKNSASYAGFGYWLGGVVMMNCEGDRSDDRRSRDRDGGQSSRGRRRTGPGRRRRTLSASPRTVPGTSG